MRGRKVVAKKLGEVLISRGLITENQLNEALEMQKKDGRRLGQILVSLKYITEEAIAWALTIMYNYPYLPLENYTLDKDVVKLISEEDARKFMTMAVDRIGSVLTLAIVAPLKDEDLQYLEKLTKCKLEIFITTMTELNRVMDKIYKNETEADTKAKKGD